jgi:hypothetical protein
MDSMYIALPATGVPYGAKVTDVEHEILIDDRNNEMNFWWSDYE